MPTYARRQIVVEDKVGVYHCIARCVRRAFLCGMDPYTGLGFSHRKEWILDRMRELAGLFAIEVCGYSVMSNHLHLVLRNRPDIARLCVGHWLNAEL
jgi:putative transposase